MNDEKKLKVAMVVSDEREVRRRYADLEPSFGPAPDAVLSGLAQLGDCEVHTVCCVQRPVRCPERILETVWHHSLHVPKIGWLRTGYIGCWRAIRAELREIRPDVVHGQGTERYCALAATASGYPNVITIHGHMRRIAKINRARPFTFEWIQGRLEKLVLPRTGGVICISAYAQKQVAAEARRTWVVPNALRSSFFHATNEPESPPIVLCLATISVVKNQNALIRALDPLAARLKFRLRFLGGIVETSDYAKEFTALVRARAWCEYLGWAEPPVIQRHLGQASALILPSVEENLGLVILEAMAAGVPVAGSAVGGIVDLITEGETGLLFDPNDSESMRSKVELLLEKTAWARSMAARAKVAVERYRPEAIARVHLEIYRKMAKTRQN